MGCKYNKNGFCVYWQCKCEYDKNAQDVCDDWEDEQ